MKPQGSQAAESSQQFGQQVQSFIDNLLLLTCRQGFAPTNSLLGQVNDNYILYELYADIMFPQPSMLSMFGSGTLLQMQGQVVVAAMSFDRSFVLQGSAPSFLALCKYHGLSKSTDANAGQLSEIVLRN